MKFIIFIYNYIIFNSFFISFTFKNLLFLPELYSKFLFTFLTFFCFKYFLYKDSDNGLFDLSSDGLKIT